MTTSSSTAEPRGRRLARSTLLNLLGQAVPLGVGVLAIPIAVRALGEARFGILGLIWAVVGFVPALDLGLGRATIKLLAEALARGDASRVRHVATLSVVGQAGLGMLAAVGLALATPTLIERFLGIPAMLRAEARVTFLVLAASIPCVALAGALRSVVEGAQRFDIVNFIRTPTTAAMFLIPAIAAPLGATLPTIVLLLLVVRLAACAALAGCMPRVFPGFRWDLRGSRPLARSMLSYGGWVAVSNAVNPLLAYAERFLLASLAGVAAAAYYTAPYEAVTRLSIVPAALAGVLLPAVSARGASTELLMRSVRYLLLGLAPAVAVLVALAAPLLDVWLGPDYAARSAPAFALLAIGVLINGLGYVPSAYLYGRGRPDLPAKFHLIELPLYLLTAWLLIGEMGVTGAALAWTLRVTVDALLLYGVTGRVARIAPWRLLGRRGALAATLVASLTLVAAILALHPLSRAATQIAFAGIAAIAFTFGVWRLVFDDTERTELRRAVL